MKGMKLPTRPAPTVQDARYKKNVNQAFPEKKKAPPRPPPPKFNKCMSQSAWNLNQDSSVSLIEWSPPSSPKSTKHHPFGGSISSSFSSSTSSLASSKKSLEYESVPLNVNPWNTNVPFPFPTYGLQAKTNAQQPTKSVPTIIRAQPPKKGVAKSDFSAPMPRGPPPSPPKVIEDVVTPFGVALYDYQATQSDDLQLHVNDIVYIIRKVNNEWLYGRVDDREGMFPANFIDVHIPLHDDNMVTALYEFNPQMQGDLKLQPGQKIRVINRVSNEWLFGESEGVQGQFPSNFVDKIPAHI